MSEAVKAITLVKRNSFSREGINPRNILRLLRHFTGFLLLILKIRLLLFEFNYDIEKNKFCDKNEKEEKE